MQNFISDIQYFKMQTLTLESTIAIIKSHTISQWRGGDHDLKFLTEKIQLTYNYLK